MITTAPFTVKASTLQRLIINRWLGRWWWILTLPVAIFIALAVAQSRIEWVIVALMAIFIVIPMIMSIVYIKYCFQPLIQLQVALHSVSLSPTGDITLTRCYNDDDSIATSVREGRHIAIPSNATVNYSRRATTIVIETGSRPGDIVLINLPDVDTLHGNNPAGEIEQIIKTTIINNIVKR